MGIKVLKAGMLTTVQDLGRFGFQRYGMVVSGAMDSLALRLGNILIGNNESEAALECTMLGPTLLFEKAQRVSVTGADLSVKLDGIPMPMWKPMNITAGSVLSFGKATRGCRSYICFYGGLALSAVLGSKATYMRAELGGWKGRALHKNDVIPFKHVHRDAIKHFSWQLANDLYPDMSSSVIRVIKGPHFQYFDEVSRNNFLQEPFTILNDSDRMGYRLGSVALQLRSPMELLSSAVTYGTIQVPPQGQAIALMADHPTTGGYPIIAQVIEADLPLLAQKQPQERIKFEHVTVERAQQLLNKRHRQIQCLKQSIALKYGK